MIPNYLPVGGTTPPAAAPQDAKALHEEVKARTVTIGKLISELRGIIESPINAGRLWLMADLAHRIVSDADLILAELDAMEASDDQHH